ncbi:nuclear cap binding complex subunit [Yamadazyma tenuis]|uniref:Nuclear cap-binding protein subunit 2 n=1 Tax=Candida tenuis (strain ATCC 10573 / BCRC 21748 / CBS 615 / JCM 9827 / NBRC 10315 / NRRL Y-1498 / VKM Y-70) TaxID=590646 RepID=G3B4G3_CANTC|nr:RNA-binding domain-containing protein [Yamadazyma tenuis ATCC 10573]EGV63820.1 RNA-binding domain-containing protein [Yamadazyma tenuis ATCC 10573]WEJ96571.1 nuclear cap binding complex subunit [Yamadazyma tenuis]
MEILEENYQHSADRLDKPSQYLIKRAIRRQDFDDLQKALTSKTIYVGNLSNFTTEEQLFELFSKCGNIDRIIMGLDRNKLTPCGFCFVIYKEEGGSLNAIKYLKATVLDGQSLEIDLDPGFREGRQFGRGLYGGQAAHEGSVNAPRGGYRGNFRGNPRGGFRGRGGPNFRGRGFFRGRGNFRGRGGYSGSSGFQGGDYPPEGPMH